MVAIALMSKVTYVVKGENSYQSAGPKFFKLGKEILQGGKLCLADPGRKDQGLKVKLCRNHLLTKLSRGYTALTCMKLHS